MKKPNKKKPQIKYPLVNPPNTPSWYQDGLKDWSNDEIFSGLRDYGLTMDVAAFRQEAIDQFEPAELAAIWGDLINRAPGRWEDFFQFPNPQNLPLRWVPSRKRFGVIIVSRSFN